MNKIFAPIRNRIVNAPGDRRVHRRAIRNIIERTGKAEWLYEEIAVRFDKIGYATFPDAPGEACPVVYEIPAGRTIPGWVRVDPNRIVFDEAEASQPSGRIGTPAFVIFVRDRSEAIETYMPLGKLSSSGIPGADEYNGQLVVESTGETLNADDNIYRYRCAYVVGKDHEDALRVLNPSGDCWIILS